MVATNFIVGRCTASAIASASRKSFFWPFEYGRTYHDVERVLADIDADHGDCAVEFLRHGPHAVQRLQIELLGVRRRELIALLGSAAAAWPMAAHAQQPAMPVVGFLYSGVPELSTGVVAAVRNGLAEAGFVRRA